MNGNNNRQHPLVRFILTQMQLTGNIPSLTASMDVEFNNIPFHLAAQDKKAILRFDKWSEAVAFFMEMKKYASDFPSLISDIRHFLEAIDLTVCLQNSRLAIIGPQAGLLLSGLFSVASRFNSKQQ